MILDYLKIDSTPITEIEKLPDLQGIYFIVSNDEVFYIGKTKSFLNRFKNHHRFKDFWKINEVSRVSINHCQILGDDKKLSSIELENIGFYNPVLNHTHAQSRRDSFPMSKRFAATLLNVSDMTVGRWTECLEQNGVRVLNRKGKITESGFNSLLEHSKSPRKTPVVKGKITTKNEDSLNLLRTVINLCDSPENLSDIKAILETVHNLILRNGEQ